MTNIATTNLVSPLLIEKNNSVARLTLNRPERRNALSRELVEQLNSALATIEGEQQTRVVIISARGPVFCAGHDLSEMQNLGEDEYRAVFEECARMMLGIRRIPQPVIDLVRPILAASPLTIQIGKRAFYEQLHLSEEDAYVSAVDVITQNAVTDDAQEGIAAFLQKRTAAWNGT